MPETSRRSVLRSFGIAGAGALAGGGAVAGAAAAAAADGGVLQFKEINDPASLPDRRAQRPAHSHTKAIWSVDTEKKLIALTFDDGPHPEWTPKLLDTLKAADVPATFFLVGKRVRAYADIYRGRDLSRLEFGNHTWAHDDLSVRGLEDARETLRRTHEEIGRVLNRQPTLIRPPWARLGGSTLVVANELGCDIALWSMMMLEPEYEKDPPGLVSYVVDNAKPGTILLAHDHGRPIRLVALDGIADMVKGLRGRGYEFTTVSQLLAEQPAVPPHA